MWLPSTEELSACPSDSPPSLPTCSVPPEAFHGSGIIPPQEAPPQTPVLAGSYLVGVAVLP